MKKIFFILVSGSLIFLLTGCFVSELGSMSGRERIEYLKSIKPYGAHWIKEGMTRDERRQDSWSCGADSTFHAADYVVFSKEKKALARLPSDQSDYGPDDRLTKQWESCMRSKNYVYLHQCDARCLYP
jgi:hypothetical protein